MSQKRKRLSPQCEIALALMLMLTVSACDATDPSVAVAPTPSTPAPVATAAATPTDQAALINEVAATLQACSYDGEPVSFNGKSGDAPSDCRDMVARIMNFTGLPQNFVVVQADVPNAAAAILLDDQKIPKRVIAFNPRFIDVVVKATRGNIWAPVSIMAHEIGHHLSGHTITPGGSQPPIELEADKFSGFVLYKMGANLDDAQTALQALVPDGPDGKTHPGRARRLSAVREGWQQACVQQHGTCDDGRSTPLANNATPARSPARSTPGTAPPQSKPSTTSAQEVPANDIGSRDVAATASTRSSSGSAPAVGRHEPASSNAVTATVTGADQLPPPGSIPSKGDRFIYDEFGVLDPAVKASFEAKLLAHARQHGVEIVTLLVRDLHGLEADQYALAMMRQLRVGKLDVGNGAVVVVAPEQGQAAVVWGPGIARQMGLGNPTRSLGEWLKLGWPMCVRNHTCGNWTENLLLTADHMMRDTDEVEWTIRFQSISAMMQAREEKAEGSVGDPTYQKIATFQGTVIARNVKADYAGAFVNTSRLAVNDAVHVQTDDGYKLMVYVVPGTESLMPGGDLKAGARYQFVARSGGLTHNKNDTQEFELLSYSQLD